MADGARAALAHRRSLVDLAHHEEVGDLFPAERAELLDRILQRARVDRLDHAVLADHGDRARHDHARGGVALAPAAERAGRRALDEGAGVEVVPAVTARRVESEVALLERAFDE